MGFNKLGADSKGVSGVNPKYLVTAKSGGTSLEISPFGNRHALDKESQLFWSTGVLEYWSTGKS